MTMEDFKTTVAAMLQQDPKIALDLLRTVRDSIHAMDRPAVEFITDDDGEILIEFEGEQIPFEHLTVVDYANRWTYLGEVDFDERAVYPVYDDSGEFHAVGYFLEHNGGMIPVRLPEGWKEN